ncbi:MAG: hypothetical protein L0H55_07600 [Candidatus Nitrosocosmicus sp.]|nr:hypothetical protein [Candidatus Nitrosocosmicus sp.]
MFPINSKPFRIPFSDWTVKWWQWLAGIPKPYNPASDQTGEFMTISQENSVVIFLCQTIEGTGGILTRKYTLKDKRFFFMPIINWISIQDVDGKSDDDLLHTAKIKMDVIDLLDLSINGFRFKDLVKNRVRSEFFNIDLPSNNIFDLNEGQKRCLSDGYWVFFHTCSDYLQLSTNSSCSLGITQIGINYHLRIE